MPAIDKEVVDIDSLIKVSVTLTGEVNGVFVTEKSYEGFTVKELNNGASNATFDWLVIAKRRAIVDAENGGNVNEETPRRIQKAQRADCPPEEIPLEESSDFEAKYQLRFCKSGRKYSTRGCVSLIKWRK